MQDITTLSQVKIDTKAPQFTLPAYNPISDGEQIVSLENLHGKWVILFFYPADFTFVCPTELKDMANAKEQFEQLGVQVLAISTDTIYSHRAWVQHEGLMKNFPYLMLADHGLHISQAYNLLDENTGIAGRGTFIIDPEGICRGIEVTSGPLWRNSDELIRKIEALQFMASHPGTACPARRKSGSKTLKPSIKISWKVAEELE